ncbi:MAG: hypothetical protein Q7J10_03665 [Methanosarcinaceae archaeon]|nr:hypothetical protein [Methanosarcinaceae archaeon]
MEVIINETETHRGVTFKEDISYDEKYLTLYRNQLLENVNYAQAVMGEPELFNLSNFDVEYHLQHYMNLYRITLFPFQLISMDDIKETIDKLANKERVKNIKEQAQYSSPSLYNITSVISQTVAGIFGMAVSSERIHITKAVLERGYYRKTETMTSTNGSYEKNRLAENNIDGDLFVSGGAVSSSKIEVEKSSCWFLNNSDEGYITFRTSTPKGLQRYGEVVHDCKFTGPCKLTLGGVFVVKDDDLLKGIGLQESKWKISSDGICGIKLHFVETIGEKEIQCNYVQLLESGVYNLKEYYVDFEAHVRALLHEAGCMIKW